jgi:hypothetical protein
MVFCASDMMGAAAQQRVQQRVLLELLDTGSRSQ